MAELIIDGDQLVVRMKATEKLEAVHGEVRVLLRSVRTVEVLEVAARGSSWVSCRNRNPGVGRNWHLQLPRGQDLRGGPSPHATRCPRAPGRR